MKYVYIVEVSNQNYPEIGPKPICAFLNQKNAKAFLSKIKEYSQDFYKHGIITEKDLMKWRTNHPAFSKDLYSFLTDFESEYVVFNIKKIKLNEEI